MLEVDLGPGVRAAFTRAGPTPDAPQGYNLSRVLGDDDTQVLRRRAAVRSWAGAPVVYARQVHGAVVHVLDAPPSPDLWDVPVAEADAVVALGAAVAVAVLVADCVPVLLADAEAGVVAAVHAGRRGLAAGVVQEALATMTASGARPGRVRAVVGPAICGACYEVPADLQREVDDVVPGTASTTSWGTPALDLPAGVEAVLTAAGVARVERLGACTLTDPRWYSHRAHLASGRPAGRFAGVVALGGAVASVSHRPGRGSGLA